MPVFALLLLFVGVTLTGIASGVSAAKAQACHFWVAPYPEGDNSHEGTEDKPWATLEYASKEVEDDNCTVWVAEGTYYGEVHFVQRFETVTTFRAVKPYHTTLENRGTVLNFDGANNIVIEGFIVRHTAPGGGPQVVKIDRSSEAWSENITLRNNIIHDSYNDDLLKIYNGVRNVVIENNIFYNQASAEEHIDINSVTDITVQDNIFFNNFAASGRINAKDTKSFITIKDSNGNDDGQLGSERIHVRRNIFLNWEGGKETFLQIGNDGKPYHEAVDVWVENNLLLGNGVDPVYAAFGLRGVKSVTIANNTIAGDLPSSAYAMWVSVKDENPLNEDIVFANNIWSDPTGTMGAGGESSRKFSNGDPDETEGLLLENNVYWNGEKKVPSGDLVSPLKDDENGIVADPLLNKQKSEVVLPLWDGLSFQSGAISIRHEFIRLVETYGKTNTGSAAIGKASATWAAQDDILGQLRAGKPDVGAYEFYPVLTGGALLTRISLNWAALDEPLAASFAISYTDGNESHVVRNIDPDTFSYILTGLVPYTFYSVTVIALDDDNRTLSQSTPLVLMTTDNSSMFLPGLNAQQPFRESMRAAQNHALQDEKSVLYEP